METLIEKKIYLIRHGETDNNQNHILQGGNVDLGLNETGRAQSLAFFNEYKDMPFKKIYTSTLKRSIESVQGFIDAGIPWEQSTDLNEISYGIHDGKTPSFDPLYTELVENWEQGRLDLKLEGGENPLEVQKRLNHFLETILQRKEEDLILISMHGRAMRIFLATILHYELSYMQYFSHNNLGLYELNYTGNMFTIDRFNDTRHLHKYIHQQF